MNYLICLFISVLITCTLSLDNIFQSEVTFPPPQVVQPQIFHKGELCHENDASLFYQNYCHSSKRILVIAQNVLMPTQLGCDKRAFYVLEALVALGHDVHLTSLLPASLTPTPEDREMMDQLHISVYAKPIMRREDPLVEYRNILTVMEPDIVIMWLWFWTINLSVPGVLLESTRLAIPTAKVVVFTDDVHSIREKQLALQQHSPDQYARVIARADKMQHAELKIYRACDLIVVITESDKKDVITLDPLHLRNKVETVRYVVGPWELTASKGTLSDEQSFDKRKDLVFVGNGNNPTNIIALRWFVDNVAERLSKEIPGVTVHCVGNYWKKFVASVPHAEKFVHFTGYLSEEDMDTLIDSSKVFISPIVASTGINTKNVLALSKGIPLVTMAPGSKGLCELCGEEIDFDITRNCSHDLTMIQPFSIEPSSTIPLMIAQDGCEFIHRIALLYSSENMWSEYSVKGPLHVASWFDRSAGALDIAMMLRKLEGVRPRAYEALGLFVPGKKEKRNRKSRSF